MRDSGSPDLSPCCSDQPTSRQVAVFPWRQVIRTFLGLQTDGCGVWLVPQARVRLWDYPPAPARRISVASACRGIQGAAEGLESVEHWLASPPRGLLTCG